MQADPDELAGVADLFGALTRAEVRAAFGDLAARAGEDFDADALDAAVADALEGYYLVAVDASEVGAAARGGTEEGQTEEGETDDEGDAGPGDREMLANGPVALPRLPEGGEDLPHLVDVDRRDVDRETLAEAAHVRLRGDAARAVADGDEERVATLLDVCYDLEAWGPVETDELRGRLDDAL